MKKFFSILVASVLFLLTTGWFFRSHLARFYYRQQWENDLVVVNKYLKLHTEAILEDRAILESHPFFAQGTWKSDAAPFMEGLKDPVADDTWLKELHKFDHWSVPAKFDSSYQFYDFDLPEFKKFFLAAKAHVTSAKNKGNYREPLMHTRQLAKLIWSQDSVVAKSMALKILELEDLIPTRVEELPIIDQKLRRRARRYSRVIPAFFDLRLDEEGFQRLTNTDYSLCQMRYDATISYNSMGPYLLHELPEVFKRHRTIIDRARRECLSSKVYAVWDQGLPEKVEPEWLPILGYISEQVAGPNHFEGYEKSLDAD